jgi:hypothetical protein
MVVLTGAEDAGIGWNLQVNAAVFFLLASSPARHSSLQAAAQARVARQG